MNKLFLASLAGLGIFAVGCGTGDEVVATPDANREVVVDMGEFTFGVDVIEVTQGETVTFVLVNVGDNEHEFMIGRDLQETEEGYPNGFEHDFFESSDPIVDPASAGMDMGAMDMDMDMEGMDMGDDDHADDEEGMDMEGMDMGDDDDMAGMDMGEDDDMAGMDMDEDDDMAGMDMDEDDDMAGMDMGDDEDDDHADDDTADDTMAGMDMGGDVHAGFMVQRRPGEVARLTVTIPEDALGVWEIGCFRGRGSHWDAGMNATLVVLEA